MDTELLIAEVLSRPAIWLSKHPHHKLKNVIKRSWDEIKQTFSGNQVDELKKWNNLKDTYRRELKKFPTSRSGDPRLDYESPWKYFGLLGFLKDEYMPIEGESNLMLTENLEETQIEDLAEESSSSMPQPSQNPTLFPCSPQPSTSADLSRQSQPQGLISQTKILNSSRKRSTPNEIRAEYLEIEKKKLKLLELEVAKTTNQETPTKSDDYHFLMSLLPEIDKLNVMQRLRLRNKFTQALMDEISLSQYGNTYGYYTEPTNNSTYSNSDNSNSNM